MNDQREAQRPAGRPSQALALRLLGPLEAELEGEPIDLGPPKQRALLAQLAVRPGEAVPVERLIDELWPDHPPETARHAIHVYVSGLRRAFRDPTRLPALSHAYSLRLGSGELDLERFRTLVADGRALLVDEPSRAAQRLCEALSLWRGRALADLGGEPGVRDVVSELEEEHLHALELRLEAQLASGDHGELVPELQRLVTEHPASEAFHAHLMLALYRSGRQAEALDTYRHARRTLLDELGLEPSPRLRELEAAILRQDPTLIVESQELRSRRHLPAPPNALIGREQEVAEVAELLSSAGVRLVTLIGPGGVGKTRLAVAVAHQLAGSYPDGVWFVDNAPLRDPALFSAGLARALDAKVSLRRHLAGKRLLLLLDNFEQLLDAALDVADLLKTCPELDLLVTSRERLRLSGEHVYEVPTLREPEAIALFAARARAVRHDFRPGATEKAISRRLDGLPLAIELAAARLADLEASELLGRLDRRLPALTGGPRDAPMRQQTLRATIEWSHDLLDAGEGRLFARLGVFAGGWTAEAAAEVCKADSDTLQALGDKSLIRQEGGRHSMLEAVRHFALERLDAGQAAAVRLRHAEWCVRILEQAWPELREGDQRLWLDRLERERDNIRAALDFAADSGLHDLELKLAARAGRFWYMQSDLVEGRRRLAHALEQTNVDAGLRASAMESQALLAIDRGDFAEAKRLTADLLDNVESLEPQQRGGAFAVRALALYSSGDLAGAATFHERALELGRANNLVWMTRVALNNLGVIALDRRDWERARDSFEEALALEPERDLHLTSVVHANLGFLAVETGDLDEAPARLLDSLRIVADLGLRHTTVEETLLASARVLASSGNVEDALRLLAAVNRRLDGTGAATWTTFGTVQARVDSLTRELSAMRKRKTAFGEPLSLDAAVALALERLERPRADAPAELAL